MLIRHAVAGRPPRAEERRHASARTALGDPSARAAGCSRPRASSSSGGKAIRRERRFDAARGRSWPADGLIRDAVRRAVQWWREHHRAPHRPPLPDGPVPRRRARPVGSRRRAGAARAPAPRCAACDSAPVADADARAARGARASTCMRRPAGSTCSRARARWSRARASPQEAPVVRAARERGLARARRARDRVAAARRTSSSPSPGPTARRRRSS